MVPAEKAHKSLVTRRTGHTDIYGYIPLVHCFIPNVYFNYATREMFQSAGNTPVWQVTKCATKNKIDFVCAHARSYVPNKVTQVHKKRHNIIESLCPANRRVNLSIE